MFALCPKVFSDISYTVASCTENEASRYGELCLLSVISPEERPTGPGVRFLKVPVITDRKAVLCLLCLHLKPKFYYLSE